MSFVCVPSLGKTSIPSWLTFQVCGAVYCLDCDTSDTSECHLLSCRAGSATQNLCPSLLLFLYALERHHFTLNLSLQINF